MEWNTKKILIGLNFEGGFIPSDSNVLGSFGAASSFTDPFVILGNHYSGLIREVWKDLGGYQVSDLTSNSNFPNNPSSIEVIDNFDAPFNVEDNYGSRLRGFFIAPETGHYR